MARIDYETTTEAWRAPDVGDETEGWGIWYGPAGVDGDVATYAELNCGMWQVTEYQNVTGLIEDVDPEYPFLLSTIWLDNDELPLRQAVAEGIALIQEQGPTSETYENSLPR